VSRTKADRWMPSALASAVAPAAGITAGDPAGRSPCHRLNCRPCVRAHRRAARG
jgi:hypothetical protein